MTQASRVSQKSSSPGIAAWLARVQLETWLLCLLGVIALLLRLIPLQGASTDYDEGVYWQSLRAMSLGHPLFTSIFSSQPPFFLLSLYPIYSFLALFLGQSLVAARMGIVVYSLIGLAAMYLAARSLGGRWVGLLALALLVADPFYLKESYTLQAEVPAIAWELVALALGVAAANASGNRSRLLALAAGVALGLGILTKLFDVFILIPIALYLLAPAAQAAWSHEGGRLRFQGRQALIEASSPALPDVGLVLAGCLLAFVLVLLPFAGNLGTVYDQVIHYHLAASQYAGHSLGYNIKLVLDNPIEYPLALLALVSVVMAVRERWWILLVPVLWLLVTLAFLLKQQPLLDHDRLILVPPLVLIGSLIIWPCRPRPAGTAHPVTPPGRGILASGQALLRLSVAVVLLSLFIGVVGTHRDSGSPLPQATVEMASALRAATLPGALVASDDQYIAGLADRNVPPELVDTSQVRILSGYLSVSRLESLITRYDVRVILFASGRFDMIPGFRSWVEANFTQIADFGDGRALYMKAPQGPQPA